MTAPRTVTVELYDDECKALAAAYDNCLAPTSPGFYKLIDGDVRAGVLMAVAEKVVETGRGVVS